MEIKQIFLFADKYIIVCNKFQRSYWLKINLFCFTLFYKKMLQEYFHMR